jgi:hypothetical protein
MSPNSGELVKGSDGFYIIIGKPGDYDLFRVSKLDDIGHYKRKWEAVEAIKRTTV